MAFTPSATQATSHDRRYQLLEPLGHGGMGAVYSALDRFTRRRVALKQVYLPEKQRQFSQTVDGVDLRLALTREFQMLASLRHPHIIQVLDYGFLADGQPFFTMTLLENAQTLLEAAQDQPFVVQVRLLMQCLQALDYLHRRELIHHDLKPANVLVEEGRVFLVDFGLAMVQTDEEDPAVGGTLAYMSPELLQFGQLSPAGDLYSVGVMAYEIFAGRLPFLAEDMTMLMFDILSAKPDMSVVDVPPPVAAVIERLLAKDPAVRYASASEVLEDLSRASGVPLPPETIEIRESYLQAARFVGREAELAQLDTALRDILPGTEDTAQHANAPQWKGSAWLIGGESGVGKSRLVDELRTLALVRGAQVLHGQALAEGGAVYQVWREPLRRLALRTPLSDYEASLLKSLIPDLDVLLERPVDEPPVLDAQSLRGEILSLIIGIFQRQQQPIVLALEDLHWVNESLDILEALLPVVETLPLLIVATYRDDTAPNLSLRLRRMQVMRLDRLNAKAIAMLSASMLGKVGQRREIVQLLQRETEGNVFFLVETVRALANAAGNLEGIGRITLPVTITSGGIQLIIQKRLEMVPESARPLLRLAATAGRQLDLSVLQHLQHSLENDTGHEVRNLESWLDKTANASVIEQRDGVWRFTHDKLRDALLTSIDPAEKAVLSRRVAEAIEEVYRDDPGRIPAALLAYHWRAAGDDRRELFYSIAATHDALNVSAYRDAHEFGQRAVELSRKLGEDRLTLIDHLFALLKAVQYSAERQDTLNLLEEIRGLLEHEDDAARTAQFEAAYALFHIEVGQIDTAETYLLQAQRHAAALDDPELEALILGNLGKLAWERDDFPTALRYLNETLVLAEQTQQMQRICYTLNMLGIVYATQGDVAQGRAYFEKVLEVAHQSGERGRIAQALSNLGVLLQASVNDQEAALDYLRQALELQWETGNISGMASARFAIANLYVRMKQPDLARGHLYSGLKDAMRVEAIPVVLQYLSFIGEEFASASTALMLFSFCRSHPLERTTRYQHYDRLIESRRSLLSPEIAAAALVQGSSLTITEAVALAEDLLSDD